MMLHDCLTITREGTLICPKLLATKQSCLFRVLEAFPFQLTVDDRVQIVGHAYRDSAGDKAL
jgi:hypothetical protein